MQSHQRYNNTMSRRSNPAMNALVMAGVLGFLVFAVYTYHKTNTELSRKTKSVERLTQEHDSLSAQLQGGFRRKQRVRLYWLWLSCLFSYHIHLYRYITDRFTVNSPIITHSASWKFTKKDLLLYTFKTKNFSWKSKNFKVVYKHTVRPCYIRGVKGKTMMCMYCARRI